MNQKFKIFSKVIATLTAVFLILPIAGCKKEKTPEIKLTAPVTELKCSSPPAISALFPGKSGELVICSSDYDNNITTVQIIDFKNDKIMNETVIEGAWAFKSQGFSDGRIAIYNYDSLEYKFLDTALKEINTVKVETVDGYWNNNCDTYYYLRDRVLCKMNISDGSTERVGLSLDLRFLEISAFENTSGNVVMQFYLSNYSGECGTALINVNTGDISMLQDKRFQSYFTENGLSFMAFDENTMNYSLYYGSYEGNFKFVDSSIFSNSSDELYCVSNSKYAVGISNENTSLYSCDDKISECQLNKNGITGEIRYICSISDGNLLAGAVYDGRAFKIYMIDPAQLSFSNIADAAVIENIITVDGKIAENNFKGSETLSLAKSLSEARKQADSLEEKYGVSILISSQCKDAVALCLDRKIHITDAMDKDEELRGVTRALQSFNRVLSLYPEGFFKQFKNSMGEGGIRFLLVGEIESNNGTVGCAYENGDWQFVAVDVRMAEGLDGIICHEIWHSTENIILSKDYSAFDIDKWSSINPKGFKYNETEDVPDKNQLRWTYNSGATKDIYFVDSYGRTNAKEDRARIMEYFMAHEDDAKQLIKYPAIKQKLKMMCDAVRNNFDTTGWDNVRWEKYL